eukprot:723948-Prymnesium_polylepis.1
MEHWTDDEKMLATLQKVSHDNIEGARKALIDLHQVLPEVCLEINTRQAARIMLNAARHKVKDMEAHGVLPELQANMMIAQVEAQTRQLYAPSRIWHAPSLIWHAPSLIWHASSLIRHAPSLIRQVETQMRKLQLAKTTIELSKEKVRAALGMRCRIRKEKVPH